MSEMRLDAVPNLPAELCTPLQELLHQAVAALGDELVAVVLYGSGAEGKLRATSDVNLLFVLTQYTQARVDPLREALRVARAVANVTAMFVLREELPAVSEAFAMKFADIANRHVVLYGDDPFINLEVSREVQIAQLRQAVWNLMLRLRERYALVSLREEQLALVLADVAGPLRVAAATLLALQGRPAATAKEALERLAPELGVDGAAAALAHLSTARETRLLPPGVAAETCFTVLALLDSLRRQAEELSA